MNNIVEIKQLEKKYGNKEVLKGLNLTIASGQIVGLLGPNGCGKTTLIKTIVGLIKDYKGSVLIDGNTPNTYTKSIVSYLPEKTYLSNWMTVKDAFCLFDDFYTNFNNYLIINVNFFNANQGQEARPQGYRFWTD